MGFYWRQSVRLGPVRLNFSKSGVGYSVGVKGLRYGVRADGRSYVSAGAHGFYYRETFGTGTRRRPLAGMGGAWPNSPPTSPPVPGSGPPAIGATESFDSAAAEQLPVSTNDALIELLRKSSTSRFKLVIVSFVATVLAGLASYASPLLGFVTCGLAARTMWVVGRWENRRRTIYLQYDPSGNPYKAFLQVVEAFNLVASSCRIRLVTSNLRLFGTHESKRNAGATSLFDSVAVSLGEGDMPGVEANIPIPTVTARGQTFYFLPDRIVIFDRTGIGEVGYTEVSAVVDTVRIIEETAPADSIIARYTWLHPNRDGGPDRRFSQNYQLPVCIYTEVVLHSQSGLDVRLRASQSQIGPAFESSFQQVRFLAAQHRNRLAKISAPDDPYLGVNEEHFQSLRQVFSKTISDTRIGLTSRAKGTVSTTDAWLARIAGDGNTIVYRFLQCLTVAASSAAVVGLAFVLALLTTW